MQADIARAPNCGRPKTLLFDFLIDEVFSQSPIYQTYQESVERTPEQPEALHRLVHV